MAAAPALTTPSTAAVGSFTPAAFAEHLASVPALWHERKRSAYARFEALPMPTRTDESWRFSTISGIKLDGYVHDQASTRDAKAAKGAFSLAAEPTLTFVNGRLGTRNALRDSVAAAGVVVCTLTEAAERHPELFRQHFMAQPQKLGSAKFAALHEAFIADGAFVYVPRGVQVEEPIVLIHSAEGPGTAVFPHTLVIAEENSKVTIVDHFLSNDEFGHFACGANDLYAGHGAKITYVAAQSWSMESLSMQFNSTVVRRDARVQSLNLHLGAKQARHESLSQLQAPGGFSEMLALTVATGAREFDQRTLQIHQAPNTKSDLLYKNALLDKARTIFSGLIVVDPDAQKTDAYQSNRNLMLSEDAESNSLPGLEIQANDVRCTHGATSAPIDADQAFYLKSRGIPEKAAHELLVFGFFEDVLSRLENEELHSAIRGLIRRRFGK